MSFNKAEAYEWFQKGQQIKFLLCRNCGWHKIMSYGTGAYANRCTCGCTISWLRLSDLEYQRWSGYIDQFGMLAFIKKYQEVHKETKEKQDEPDTRNKEVLKFASKLAKDRRGCSLNSVHAGRRALGDGRTVRGPAGNSTIPGNVRPKDSASS